MPTLQSFLIRLVVMIIAVTGAYFIGSWRATTACQDRAEITALKKQVEVTKEAEKVATQKATELQALALDNQEIIDDLQDAIASQEGRDHCRLSDDDARRLRNIK